MNHISTKLKNTFFILGFLLLGVIVNTGVGFLISENELYWQVVPSMGNPAEFTFENGDLIYAKPACGEKETSLFIGLYLPAFQESGVANCTIQHTSIIGFVFNLVVVIGLIWYVFIRNKVHHAK